MNIEKLLISRNGFEDRSETRYPSVGLFGGLGVALLKVRMGGSVVRWVICGMTVFTAMITEMNKRQLLLKLCATVHYRVPAAEERL
jgi:hypothetical protein